jgi:diguanylate cyclase (GGDEF)-like protein
MVLSGGVAAGRMFRLDRDEVVVGRSPGAEIFIDDEGVSRKHAKFIREGSEYRVMDLTSTNGTFVNGEKTSSALLKSGDKIQIGSTTVLLFSVQDDMEENFQRNLFEAATRDGLTGTMNRRALLEELAAELAYSRRHRVPVSVVMIDVDHFKIVNDTWGHLAGDQALIAVAQALAAATRSEDRLGRYGGEEFLLLLRETSQQQAYRCAERCRQRVEKSEIHWQDQRIKLTISLGIATLGPGGPDQPEGLIELADKALYEAKAQGRNRIVASPGQHYSEVPSRSGRERRVHARIETDLSCRVTIGDAKLVARVRDVSLSGALLVGPLADAAPGTRIQIQIDEAPTPVDVTARVVWSDEHQGQPCCGVLFEDLQLVDAEALGELLGKLVVGAGVGRRTTPRVFRRVYFKLESRQEMSVLMQDISRGGLGFLSELGAQVGEELRFEMALQQWGGTSLKLGGIVAHVAPVPGGLFKIGVKFEHLSPDEQSKLEAAIGLLLSRPTE